MHIRISLIIALTLGYSLHSYGQVYNKQNTYADALVLSSAYDEESIKRILNKYGSISELCANPFFKDLELDLCGRKAKEKSEDEMKEILVGSIRASSSASSSAIRSANWQASAINGIANFMAGRFKQEVLHAAINQIFKQIKTKHDSALVKAIFPRTFKQIVNLYGSGSSAYYTTDLLLLRQTAQLDIELLPKNMVKNANIIFPKINQEDKDILSLGSYIYEYSRQERSLDHIITSLADETYSSSSQVNKILNIADLFSQALLIEENSENKWVNPKEILPNNLSSLKDMKKNCFYGLLYQQLIAIPEFKEYLKGNEINAIADKIYNLFKFVNNLNNTYAYIESKEFKLKSPEEAVTYMKEINKSIVVLGQSLREVPAINRSFNFNENQFEVSYRYLTIVEAMMKKDYQRMIPLLLIEFGDYMGDRQLSSSRTISFVSQLAAIESADDMEALLNAYALPIGSSSIKRHSDFNMSLNGYVGITGGWETAYGSQINQMKGNIGLAAPIGVSATFCKGYLTTFLSFIDLGSIVNLRLNNDTFSYSSLKFEHFFSPGIGLFLNCPKLPVSAGLHFNYIPNLRTIKYESGTASITESNLGVTRLNFSLLVDIPFFTIYNKAKTK